MGLSPPSPLDLKPSETAGGCFTGILDRFLCGNLHRFHAEEEEEEGVCFASRQKPEAEQRMVQSPGLVARLMGLESIPAPATAPATSEPLGRSRSTNSLESWPGFLSERSHSTPVRTSTSFREAPTYLRPENEEFLVMSFAPDDNGGSFNPANGVKSKMGSHAEAEPCRKNDVARKEKRRRGGRREQRIRRSHHARAKECSRPTELPLEPTQAKEEEEEEYASQKDEVRKENRRGRRREHKNRQSHQGRAKESSRRPTEPPLEPAQANVAAAEEAECASQNSSPVSVLDHHPDIIEESSMETNSSTSEEAKPLMQQQGSRRKLSTDFESSNCSSSPLTCQARNGEDGEKPQVSSEVLSPNATDIWGRICKSAEECLRESKWVSRESWRAEDGREISAEIGKEILDRLVSEAITVLSCYAIQL